MSIQEKRRAGFETWILRESRDETELLLRDNEGEYYSVGVAEQWAMYNAALDSVVITLPAPDMPEDFGVTEAEDPEQFAMLESKAGGQLRILSKCRKAIESAGLKVKT